MNGNFPHARDLHPTWAFDGRRTSIANREAVTRSRGLPVVTVCIAGMGCRTVGSHVIPGHQRSKRPR
jgi:hypothetical protein